MLRNPCKICLVRPSCSDICDEKDKRDKILYVFKIPFVLAICAIVLLCLMIYTLFLLCLLKLRIIDDKQFKHYDPFNELGIIMDPDDFY